MTNATMTNARANKRELQAVRLGCVVHVTEYNEVSTDLTHLVTEVDGTMCGRTACGLLVLMYNGGWDIVDWLSSDQDVYTCLYCAQGREHHGA